MLLRQTILVPLSRILCFCSKRLRAGASSGDSTPAKHATDFLRLSGNESVAECRSLCPDPRLLS